MYKTRRTGDLPLNNQHNTKTFSKMSRQVGECLGTILNISHWLVCLTDSPREENTARQEIL